MSIIIQNISEHATPTGPNDYVLKINATEIARFTHRREDGLAACLLAAAAAVSQAEDARHARLLAMLLSEDPR